MKNSRGYTLIEMAVSLGLITIVIVTSSLLVFYFNKRVRTLSALQDSETEAVSALKIIKTDIEGSFVSFNNLKTVDDMGREFYELKSDVSNSMVTALDRERIITLNPSAKVPYLDMIVTDKELPNPFLYEPVKAYKVNAATNINKSGALSFISLNKGDYVSSLNKNFWKQGSYVMLYTPLSLSPPTQPKRTSRWPAYLGAINGSSLSLETVDNMFNNTHPIFPNKVVFNNEDSFLRNLPAAGGAAPAVFVKRVKVLRYYIQPTTYKTKPAYQLVRSTWINGTVDMKKGVVVAVPVKKVVFKRNSVSLPLITVDIETDKEIK